MMVGTKRVILLAGHNFISPGCNTNIDGKLITEFDLTTHLVAEIFKRERLIGIDLIIKARNDFGNLVNEVNSLNGDILISCHFNAYDKKAQGTEVLYAHTSSKGRKLASVAQDILTKHLGLSDRGIKPTKPEDRGGSILNKTKPVAILIEPFFLDNIKNKDYLEKSIEKVSNAIIEILEYVDKNEL